MRRTARWWLCAAVFLAARSSLLAQIPVGRPERSRVQVAGYAVGDPEQGQRVAQAKCASCHGEDGNSPHPEYPKLAGQNPAYLYWQIWAFKTGARTSNVMSRIASTVSDSDAADAASFYGRQQIRPDSVKDSNLASIGQRIYFGGAGFGMMTACVMCHGSAGQRSMHMGGMPMMGHGMGMMGHGMMGHGMMTNVPNLNGQHASYIVDQLNRFAHGERQGTVMNRIAAELTETKEKAVAEFLSGVP